MSYPFQPIPPRSRSRSPRAPLTNAAPYAPDIYRQDRPDWESYDRERPYYDKYEYGRRGRSRSPILEEGGRKRRRSSSPYDRDRYEPRPRYNDDFDTHSRGFGHSPSRGRRRPPPDPRTFDYPASLKQYAEWFRFMYPEEAVQEDAADKAAELEAGDGTKPRNGIKTKWEEYKKEFFAMQLKTMFAHHRKSPWFVEKYDPSEEFKALRNRVRKEGWHGRIHTFLQELDSGKYDPDMNESSAPGTAIATASKENVSMDPEQTADDSKVGGDDDMQFAIDADDEPDAADKSGDKTKENSDEIKVMPEGNQVMIRTIPPDIGRLKLEQACSNVPGFMYIALGDPLQKRNYYRAGWIRLKDDTDMSTVMAELSEKKIEGFKLHVSHNNREFISRVRYVPEVASIPERIYKDLGNIRILSGILENEAADLRKFKVEVDPDMDPTSIAYQEEEEPNERGSDAVERRVEKIMDDLRAQGLIDVNDETAYELKKATVALDLYMAYIRAAYNSCYYCCIVTDHLEELQRRCVRHVRRPLSKTLSEKLKAETERPEGDDVTVSDVKREGRDWKRNDERWTEWMDSKIALLINRDGVDPRDYGGKHYDEELSYLAKHFVKQEDEGKFRCKNCLKLFKAGSFVEKHILNKHPAIVAPIEELPFFNNFALDPHRIQPFTHPPQTVGNSSTAPPEAYGAQPGSTMFIPSAGFNNGSAGRQGNGPGQYISTYSLSASEYVQYGGANNVIGVMRETVPIPRRLSDRIGIPAHASLPPKPMTSGLDGPLASGNSNGNGRKRSQNNGPLPPPPPNAKEDPRAAAGRRVSYHDMDLVAEGDVELTY